MICYSVGYVADLAALLAKRIGFEYKLVLVPDNKYGRKNKKTGKWDGIMRELVEGVSMLPENNTFMFRQDHAMILWYICIYMAILAAPHFAYKWKLSS